MWYSGRSDVPPDAAIDTDELGRQLGAPILMPFGDSFLLSQVTWGSTEGLRSVHLVTQTPNGNRRTVNLHRGTVSLRALRILVENACAANSLEPITMLEPALPNALLRRDEVTVDGVGVQSATFVWTPMRIVMFKFNEVSVLILSLIDETGALALVGVTGVLRPAD